MLGRTYLARPSNGLITTVPAGHGTACYIIMECKQNFHPSPPEGTIL